MNDNKPAPRRFPAEWEPQDAVLLAWPHRGTDWQPMLDEAEAVFSDIIRQILRFQHVLLIVPESREVKGKLHRAGLDLRRLDCFELPCNDTWARDFGPLCVDRGGQPLLLDFTFNGWGDKFPAELDNRLSQMLQRQGAFAATPISTQDWVLEGGSIDSDGQGTLLTTSSCLLKPNRNPQLNRDQLDQLLCDQLGAEQILWLETGGLSGDDTDGHVDTLARFAPQQTIVYQGCDDPADEHYLPLQQMAEQLHGFRTLRGEPFRLLPLPLPRPCFAADGRRLPASYANFLVINGAVLVPTYGDPADEQALCIMAQAFPKRNIIGIDCRPLIEQHGSLHCVTMQLPKGVLT